MKIAQIQMESSYRKKDNLEKSLEMAREALKSAPQLIIYPEYQMHMPDYSEPDLTQDAAEPIDGPFVSAFVDLARGTHTHFLLNIAERGQPDAKPFNTSVLISDQGKILASYRKLHLFDAYGAMESSCYSQGDLSIDPADIDSVRIGLQICYDLRFPEPTRLLRLKDIRILSYQAGWFSGPTKLETWRTLLKARSMENGVFVLGTAQCGSRFTGHTLVASPYGDVLGELGSEEGILVTDLDLALLEKYSTDVPMMEHRRKDVYNVSGL